MKKKIDVIRAWRDEEYRNSLSAEERASLPENPAGLATVSDQTLRSIAGGCAMSTKYCECSNWTCSCVTPPEICP
jgi:mersacidin/lichenicidin family type 2 lantibiotic